MSYINISNLSWQFPQSDKPILKNISFNVDKGEIIGLIGPNGAGKSSLLKLLANLYPLKRGTYQLQEKSISEYSSQALAKIIAYQEQNAPIHWPLPVERVVELGRSPYLGLRQQLQDEDKQLVKDAMQKTDVMHLAHRQATELSGGERMRVLLARLFASQPDIMLADEPVASLDPYHQLHIMELLQSHAQSGGSVVVVLHDLNLAARFCDKILLLDKGELVCFESIDHILDKKLLEHVYNIDLHIDCNDEGFAITPWQRRS